MKYWVGGIALAAWGLSGCGQSADNDGRTASAGASSGGESFMTSGGAGSMASSGRGGASETNTNGGENSAGGNNASGGSKSTGGNNSTGGSVGQGGFGATSNGGVAGVAAAGAGGGSTSGMGDPKPVEPNLTGLVPTSSQWLLFSNPTSGSSFTKDLQVLDIASNQLHPANPGGAYDVLGGLSPDGRTYFFSDGDGSRDSDRIIRLEPSGFVPAHVLEGYVGIPGAYRVLSWSHDSRFAVLSNGNGPSVEVIDMRLGTRVATEKLSSIVGEFAPAGYSYFYTSALTPLYAPRYARVTERGSTAAVQLPPGAKGMAFDTTGTHLFYGVGTDQDGYKLHVLSLADGQASEIPVLEPGEIFDANRTFPTPGNSVVVELRKLSGDQRVLRRVFATSGQPAVTVSNPSASTLYTYRSADGNLLLVNHYDKSLDLIRVEPYARHTIPGAFPFSLSGTIYGIIGKRGFYVLNGSVHLIDFDSAGAARDVALSPPGVTAVACANAFEYTPEQKFAFVQGDGEELTFVDLTPQPPAIVGSFKPSAAGYRVACPTWGDSDTALALSESSGTNSHQYVTRWKASAPEPPKLLPQPIGRVLAVMYR